LCPRALFADFYGHETLGDAIERADKAKEERRRAGEEVV